MSRKNPLHESFKYAFEGIGTALKKEPNFRIQIITGVAAIVLAYYLGFSILEWLILLFTIFSVLILELINTALEAVVDLVSPDIKNEAKLAKDVSAAAVLLSAIFSLLVAVFLFLPKLL